MKIFYLAIALITLTSKAVLSAEPTCIPAPKYDSHAYVCSGQAVYGYITLDQALAQAKVNANKTANGLCYPLKALQEWWWLDKENCDESHVGVKSFYRCVNQ